MSAQLNDQPIAHPGQEGLDISVTCTKKNYIFAHGSSRRYGETQGATLGGLYDLATSDGGSTANSSTADTPKTTASYKATAKVGEPTVDERNNLSYAIEQIPAILQQQGVRILDQQLAMFHQQVKSVKQKLAQRSTNGVISAETMRSAEQYMEKYNLQGYTIRIIGYRVTKSNPKGSKARKDGLYVTTKVIRSFYIDRMLSEDSLQAICEYLLAAMAKDEITKVDHAQGYVVSRNTRGEQYYQPISSTTYSTKDGQTKTVRSSPGGVGLRRSDAF